MLILSNTAIIRAKVEDWSLGEIRHYFAFCSHPFMLRLCQIFLSVVAKQYYYYCHVSCEFFKKTVHTWN